MSVAIVTTTIHKPVLLHDYCENAKRFGHKEVSFIVVGDHKTPSGVPDFCAQLEDEFGYTVDYVDIEDQEQYLGGFKALREHLPWNSISRRNVGILKAYQEGADVVITIDDDNFVLPDEDFVGQHAVVGTEIEMTSVSSSSGWYNVCEMLDEKEGLPFYHRGFPLDQRWQAAEITAETVKGKVVVNAGLWLEAPDIDAVTWLDLPIKATKFNNKYPDGVGLGVGTWSPFNSQNTGLAREVVPAYFLSPYIGRYDDIWASYIVKKISDHLGDVIHFGRPLVRQERNPHNYLKDFDKERLGMELTSSFTEWLQQMTLSESSYEGCFGEIAKHLEDAGVEVFGEGAQEHSKSLEKFIEGLLIWQSVYERMPARA